MVYHNFHLLLRPTPSVFKNKSIQNPQQPTSHQFIQFPIFFTSTNHPKSHPQIHKPQHHQLFAPNSHPKSSKKTTCFCGPKLRDRLRPTNSSAPGFASAWPRRASHSVPPGGPRSSQPSVRVAEDRAPGGRTCLGRLLEETLETMCVFIYLYIYIYIQKKKIYIYIYNIHISILDIYRFILHLWLVDDLHFTSILMHLVSYAGFCLCIYIYMNMYVYIYIHIKTYTHTVQYVDRERERERERESWVAR